MLSKVDFRVLARQLLVENCIQRLLLVLYTPRGKKLYHFIFATTLSNLSILQ